MSTVHKRKRYIGNYNVVNVGVGGGNGYVQVLPTCVSNTPQMSTDTGKPLSTSRALWN